MKRIKKRILMFLFGEDIVRRIKNIHREVIGNTSLVHDTIRDLQGSMERKIIACVHIKINKAVKQRYKELALRIASLEDDVIKKHFESYLECAVKKQMIHERAELTDLVIKTRELAREKCAAIETHAGLYRRVIALEAEMMNKDE